MRCIGPEGLEVPESGKNKRIQGVGGRRCAFWMGDQGSRKTMRDA